MEVQRQKIRPFLMFTGSAEEAMNFYVLLFPHSRILSLKRYGKGEAGSEGSVELAHFLLQGQVYMCTDSPIKHDFSFTPSISFYVECATVEEIDGLFEALAQEGMVLMPLGEYPFARRYGWVSDRFGVSWQLSIGGSSQPQGPA